MGGAHFWRPLGKGGRHLRPLRRRTTLVSAAMVATKANHSRAAGRSRTCFWQMMYSKLNTA